VIILLSLSVMDKFIINERFAFFGNMYGEIVILYPLICSDIRGTFPRIVLCTF
jgi:hypothetical protein